MNLLFAGGGGILVILGLLFGILKWKQRKSLMQSLPQSPPPEPMVQVESVHLVHRLCPVHEVLQGLELEKKDSLDDHLDVLTQKLAEQEGRLLISKSKIRETQHEIENLSALDKDVTDRYKDMMDALKTDLQTNEKNCCRLQEQIEWVSMRRAEIRDEVRRGQKQYGQAAVDLAENLVELQKGRVTDKPQNSMMSDLNMSYSTVGVRLRKDPQLPKYPGMTIKSPQQLSGDSSSIMI